MRRSTGAIFRDTRPETIITSAWRGEARNTSEPNRARSFRPLVAFIISIAQQARPKVAGHKDDLRAQLISESSLVVKTSGSASAIMFSSPMAFSFQVSGFNFQVLFSSSNLKPETWNLKPWFVPAGGLRLPLRGERFQTNRTPLS